MKNKAVKGTKFLGCVCTCMSEQQAHVIPFRHPRAPRCENCQRRMALTRFQPDPNGGRYMFETFECRACETRHLNVRPIEASEQSPADLAVRRFLAPGRHETG